jgi:hypothetical protein
VIWVTTADRVDFGWSTPTATIVLPDDESYVGKHRKSGMRGLSVLRMFYKPRHRAD